MNHPSTVVIAVVLSLVSAGAAGMTWWCTRWWYRRQVAAAGQRLRKSELARAQLLEQAQQTRQQIGSLNKALELERAQVARLDASRRRLREVESATRPPAPARPREREPIDLALSMPMPLDGPRDFADTQILN